MVLGDSSSDDGVSEINGEESLLAYLMGFGLSRLIDSENRMNLRR